MTDRQAEPNCGLCGRRKLVVSYVDSLGQRAKLPLSDAVTEFKDKNGQAKVRLAEKFAEPYPDGHRASLLSCSNCDEVEWWPRSRQKPRKTFK